MTIGNCRKIYHFTRLYWTVFLELCERQFWSILPYKTQDLCTVHFRSPHRTSQSLTMGEKKTTIYVMDVALFCKRSKVLFVFSVLQSPEHFELKLMFDSLNFPDWLKVQKVPKHWIRGSRILWSITLNDILWTVVDSGSNL